MTAKRILIADDDKQLVEALTLRCRGLGLEVTTAYDALSTLTSVNHISPDLICVDVDMPAGNGLSVCDMLATDPNWSSIPAIVLTGKTDAATIRRCHEMCAYYVPKGTDVWERVGTLIHELLGIEPLDTDGVCQDSQAVTANPTSATVHSLCRPLVDYVFALLGCNPHRGDDSGESQTPATHEPAGDNSLPWVLSIDDDIDFSWALKRRLESHGVAVVRACDGTDGYRTAFTRPADVILLDYEMPNGQGDYVLRRLKDNPITKDIPVIILTGRRDRALERRMLNMGAATYLTKPINFHDLLQELQQHIDVLREPVAR